MIQALAENVVDIRTSAGSRRSSENRPSVQFPSYEYQDVPQRTKTPDITLEHVPSHKAMTSDVVVIEQALA